MKRILALLLSFLFLFAMLAACNNGTEEPVDNTPAPPGGEESEDEGPPVFTPPDIEMPDIDESQFVYREKDGKRHIIIGTWWDVYYDSRHESIYDNPADSINVETATMELEKVREIEEKYNVYLEFRDLTWDGIIESILVSIMSGTPDCDIYMVDMQFGLSPILNNMAIALEDMDMNPEYKEDVLAAPGLNNVMRSLPIPGTDKTYLFNAAGVDVGMYVLGYNRDMVQAAGLEDPQDLWYAGEWTWDKFREQCIALTKPDEGIYGLSVPYGFHFLTPMLFSNETVIAGNVDTTIEDPKTVETLSFIYDLYVTDKCALPFDTSDYWAANNDEPFMAQKSGFNVTAAWINQEYIRGNDVMPFEIGIVPFPTGPSAESKDSIATINAFDGNWYFIPRYIKDAGEVFNVFYDWVNWYNYPENPEWKEYRDDTEWLFDQLISDENIDIYMEVIETIGRPLGFDMWASLGGGFSMLDLTGYNEGGAFIESSYTPASMAATYHPVFQDALDHYFG